MTKNKIKPLLLVLLFFISSALTGCGGSTNTVQNCILSSEQYTEKDTLEDAAQPDNFEAGQAIYASVYFIESPLGTEYTAKWYLDGDEVKTDTKKMQTDKKGIIVFPLEADKVTAGTAKFEIVYNDDVLFSKELTVQ